MAKLYSKALDKHIEVERIIGSIKGKEAGPTLIFTGGIHGNEPSGIFALRTVLNDLKENKIPVSGEIHAISGNLWALERGERFHTKDLNRLWAGDDLEHLLTGNPSEDTNDVTEQREIYACIKDLLAKNNGPFYFMDLHTTSSETMPFLTVNDSLLNRKFTQQYPVPMILGIEEYLDGPLLSYINEMGYVAFGYEGGQHDSLSAIENHVAFIYLTLVFSGAVKKEDIEFNKYYNILAREAASTQGIYEIYYRHEIKDGDSFTMHPGYCNFQLIHKGEPLAVSNGVEINATSTGRVFMPLYQSQGNDGFFAVRKISPVFLRISAWLRLIHFDRILPVLPGIKWQSKEKATLLVNRKIARLFAKKFFHLLGYRNKRLDKNHLTISNREWNSRKNDYLGATWNT